MFDRVSFGPFSRYTLARDPARPWPEELEFDRVPSERAAAIVTAELLKDLATPNWPLMDLLGIAEHPANVDARTIESWVHERVNRFCTRYTLYREKAWERAPRSQGAPRSVAAQTVASAPVALTGFFAVEVQNERGVLLPGIQLEVRLPDGQRLTRMTDANGAFRIDGITQGTCAVRLPKLDASSWRPAAGPTAVAVGRLPARVHAVERGQHLAGISAQYGFRSWQQVWEANTALRERRESAHRLRIGDQVVIPEATIAEMERATGTTHAIVVAQGKLAAHVRLQTLAGEPLAGVRYRFCGSHKHMAPREGAAPTDEAGTLREVVPMATHSLDVELTDRSLAFRVPVGAIEPVCDEDSRTNVSAVCQRLRALGYDAGDAQTELTPQAREALIAFQALSMQRAEPSGELDAQTLRALDLATQLQSDTVEDEGLLSCVITATPFRLGAMWGPPEGWRFEPLSEGAYVVVQRRAPGPRVLLAGITDARGVVLRLDPTRTDSHAGTDELYLPAPHRYHVWWTLDQERYIEALADPSVVEQEGTTIHVKQARRAPRSSTVTRTIAEMEKELKRQPTSARIRHVIDEHLLNESATYESSSRELPIFDATPTCLRALYRVELMRWYERLAYEASANHLATFHHAAAMIHAAETGGKDNPLESRATELFPTDEERRRFEAFREYAWRCAATGVLREQFSESIAMQEGPEDLPMGSVLVLNDADAGTSPSSEARWWVAALDIREQSYAAEQGPAVHPDFAIIRAGAWSALDGRQQELLLDYFDNYRFGAQLRSTFMDGAVGFVGPTHYRGRMAARMEERDENTRALRVRACAALGRDAPPERFFFTLSSCCPRDTDLIERYIDVSAYCAFRWWALLRDGAHDDSTSPTPLEEPPDSKSAYWRHFKARTKLLADALDGASKISTLLEARLHAYDWSLEFARELLNRTALLELSLGRIDFPAAQISFEGERVTIRPRHGSDTGTLRIALPAEWASSGQKEVTLRYARLPDSPANDHLFMRGKPRVMPRVVQVPASQQFVRAVSEHAPGYGVLAETMNLAVAVQVLASDADGPDKLAATFELAKGVVGIIESLPSALAAVQRPLETTSLLQRVQPGIATASKWLGRLDHVFRIYGGVQVLCSDHVEVEYELRQGRTFRASLQRWNEIANVVTTATSAVELTGAAVSAASAGRIVGISIELLAGFSTANPWGLLLSVGGSMIAAGSDLVFDLNQPWDDRLMAIEAALDAACRAEVRDARFRVSTRLDSVRAMLEDLG